MLGCADAVLLGQSSLIDVRPRAGYPKFQTLDLLQDSWTLSVSCFFSISSTQSHPVASSIPLPAPPTQLSLLYCLPCRQASRARAASGGSPVSQASQGPLSLSGSPALLWREKCRAKRRMSGDCSTQMAPRSPGKGQTCCWAWAPAVEVFFRLLLLMSLLSKGHE
jgi:hypothetical protein